MSPDRAPETEEHPFEVSGERGLSRHTKRDADCRQELNIHQPGSTLNPKTVFMLKALATASRVDDGSRFS
jgi:hypothetical protein